MKLENNEIFKYLQVIAGSILFILGIYFFITPNGLNTGGIFGTAQLIDYFLRKSITLPASFDSAGIINMAITIPLFLLAFRTISKVFCSKTLVSVITQTITMAILPKFGTVIMPDPLSNVIAGAVMGGIGIGLCLRSSGCAGGMDILGVYFSKTRPNFSVGKLSIVLNAVLFSIYALIFDVQSSIYSIMYVFIMYFVCDRVHYQNINITAMIFTKHPEIKEDIMTRMGRGVTYWMGKGAYTETDQYILFTAINKYEIRRLYKILNEVDPNAFVILSEGQNITGGFEKRL